MLSEIKVCSEFKEWGKRAGILGNLKSELWICGIEYGGDDDLSFEMEAITTCWNDRYLEDNSDYYKWQYDRKVAKIYCCYYGIETSDYEGYMKDELYRADKNSLKMNLYPISFSNTDEDKWSHKHYKKTGFPNKTIYRAWCMVYRFGYLRKLLDAYQPKVLICTGTSYALDFKLAFAPRDKLFEDSSFKKGKFYQHKCITFKNGKTNIVIAPFLGGRYGVNSDEGLKELAKYVRSLSIGS